MFYRKHITETLTNACIHYWTKKKYSNYTEVGVRPRKSGIIKADVVSFNLKKDIVISEVKSCWSDFNTDSKWHKYLPYCHRFYFIFPEQLWETSKQADILAKIKDIDNSAGIMVLCTRTGKLKSVKPARRRDVPLPDMDWLVTKLAWVGGDSPRNIPRIKRFYLQPDTE